MDRDIELTKIIDSLEAGKSAAEALKLDLLHYLIGVALDEAREVGTKEKTGNAFGADLRTRKAK